MTSPPLDSTHGRTTSGMACHHRLWAAHRVERRWAWHDITAFGKHTGSNDVERGIPSSPFGSTYDRTMSGKAFHQSPWTAHTVERRGVWHSIMDLGQHTRSNNVGCGMLDVGRGIPSSLLNELTQSDGVGGGMPSSHLDGKHGQTMSGVACHHRLWIAYTVGRRRAWHAIISF